MRRRRGQRQFFVGEAAQRLEFLLGAVQRDLGRLRPLRVLGRGAEQAEGRQRADRQDQRGDQHLDDREARLSSRQPRLSSSRVALRRLAPSETVSAAAAARVGECAG